MTVFNEIRELDDAIGSKIRGGSRDNGFKNEYRKVLRGLLQQMKDGAPNVIVDKPGYKQPAISIYSDDDEDTSSATPVPRAKARRGNDGRAIATPARSGDTSGILQSTIKKEDGSGSTTPVKATFTLDQIKHAYHRGSTSEIPSEVNPDVTVDLVLRCLRAWPGVIENAIDQVHKITNRMLIQSIDHTLASHRGTLLFESIGSIIRRLCSDLFAAEKTILMENVACEMHKPVI